MTISMERDSGSNEQFSYGGDIHGKAGEVSEKAKGGGPEKGMEVNDNIAIGSVEEQGSSMDARVQYAVNHRRLNPRQIHLAAISGAIGAGLFVGIGSGVLCGPLALLMGFFLWGSVIFCIAQCLIEMVTLFPLDGSFIRLASRFVDPAVGVSVGYNHFFTQTASCIFEISVINTLVEYWGYDQSPAILITVGIVLYLTLNIYRADLFGEAEFWMSLGKVILAIGLMFYTFITMVGGNPLHDVYGFRYWKDPGPWVGNNSITRLESFVNAIVVAGFIMSGPEYISIMAGEAKDPRRVIPRCYKTIIFRLVFFFMGGALCVGIIVPSNDETLRTGASTYSGASPYVISMSRLHIPVLPSILTAALVTSIVSAGNAYTFQASRTLHALALEGQAPKILRRLNRKGVPYIAVIVVMTLTCLAYLAVGSSSAQVITWILQFTTAATMFNWIIVSFTWIRFNAAMKAQNIDRKTFLPLVSRMQPYAGYWAFFWAFFLIWVQGYGVFLKGHWKTLTFIFNYGIIAFSGSIGIMWKIVKRTRFHRLKEVDFETDLDFFDALTEHYRLEREAAPVTLQDKILAKLF